MKTIYKYPIGTVHEQTVTLPAGAQILTVESQMINEGEHIILYALVDTEVTECEDYRVCIYGTGRSVAASGVYLGTVKLNSGKFMFHVFVE